MDFADIQLIECNRSQSIQGRNNNDTQPAVFTCKLGQGVKLGAGDTVEILNAFVSEDGCGGENIEFIGDFIYTDNGYDEQGNPAEIVEQELEFTNINIVTDTANVKDFQHRASAVVDNGAGLKINTKVKKQVKDNETFVEQRYYKTNNGEGCLFQPRNYTMSFLGDNLFAIDDATGVGADNPRNQFPMITFFEKKDDEQQGVSFFRIPETYKFKVAECDSFLYTSGGPNTFWNAPPPDESFTTTEQWYRPRTNNKRFTMFMRDQNYKLRSAAPQVTDPTDDTKTMNWLDYQTYLFDFIASTDYVEYIQLKKLSVDAGFTTASNIAAQITEQLQQNVDYTTSEGELILQPEVLKWDHEFNGAGEQSYEIFAATTTETYFPIESGGMGRNDYETFKLVEDAHTKLDADTQADDLSVAEKQAIINYIGTTQYLFVKRPEMFIAGRKLHEYDGTITTNTNVTSNVKSYIANQITKTNPNVPLVTSFQFNEPNLKMLSDLFKAQSPYSNELGMFKDRFLHMNCMTTTKSGTTVLGDDGYEGDASANKEFFTSAPIRFKYQIEKENIYNDGMQGTNDLCYGFATRNVGTTLETGDVIDTIVVHPELATSIVGGGWNIPELFDGFALLGGHTIPSNDVIVGWDKHATSFGQVMMTSMNGMAYGPPTSLVNKNNPQFSTYVNTGSDFAIQNKTPSTDGESRWDVNHQRITEYLNFRYIGANNPSLNFNIETGSFGFQSLHTAENVNQPWDAGRSTTVFTPATATVPATTVVTNTPISAQASTECYKINKRLRYSDYTPDMKPYFVDYPQKLVYTSGDNPEYLPANMSLLEKGGKFATRLDDAVTSVAVSNQNIEEGALFDAHCGVFLNIGKTCPKRYWKQSFWGILGFTWEQFHPKTSSLLNNEQIRVGEDTMFSMKYATTNCQVVVSDLKDYPIQVWGGINYSTQIAAPMCVQIQKIDVTAAYGLKYKPYIIQNTQSITTRAQRIPKLMTRPYYTIRSDILDANKYVGGNSGGIKLSCLGVVDKMNGDGDYYFTENAGMAFTITNPITLTTITTAICDPNGRLANVNENSAVIYKVTKQDNTGKFDIVNQILQQEQKSKKQK